MSDAQDILPQVTLLHREFRLETPLVGGAYRAVGAVGDGNYCVCTLDDHASTATNEFVFDLGEAGFAAQRILAGDMAAARRPGMSRMLAAALIVLTKAGLASGTLEKRAPDDGDDHG